MALRRLALVCTTMIALAACGGGGSGGNTTDAGRITEVTRTVTGNPRLQNPRLSADGRIAFVQSVLNTDEIATMHTDGTNHRVLPGSPSYLTGFAWTTSGTELFFSGDSIFRMSSDGGTATDLLPGSDAFASFNPDVSPDGGQLIFGVNGSTLRLVDLTQTPLVVQTLTMSGSSPRFSPDGQSIVYADTAANMIRILNADGTNARDVVPSSGFMATVDWFSDGQRLIGTTDEGLEIVSIDGTQRRKLRSGHALLNVDLSPDDKTVVFTINGQLPLYLMTGF